MPHGAASITDWHGGRITESILRALLVGPTVAQSLPDGGLIDWQPLAEVRARHRFRRKVKRQG